MDFLDDEVDLEITIGAVESEKSAAGQEFNHQDFIFYILIFEFLYFWTFYGTALGSEIVLWQTKTPVGCSWLEGSVLR